MATWMYILRLKSGGLYPGVTRDLNGRLTVHFGGRACHTTTSDPPLDLVHSEEFSTFGQARKRETQIKRWSRAKKEALTHADLQLPNTLAQRRER